MLHIKKTRQDFIPLVEIRSKQQRESLLKNLQEVIEVKHSLEGLKRIGKRRERTVKNAR